MCLLDSLYTADLMVLVLLYLYFYARNPRQERSVQKRLLSTRPKKSCRTTNYNR